MTSLQPVQQNQRIDSLDILRGFSLLGILIINMVAFHSPISYYNPYEWWTGVDRGAYAYIDVLVQGSFYPLFAMLFGYGLAIQSDRMEQRGQAFIPFAIRRMAILLVIGLLHAFLIWSGDILINYAVIGLLLIWFLKLDGRWLIVLGALLFAFPRGLLAGSYISLALTDPTSVTFFSGVQEIQTSIARYGAGSYSEIFTQRYEDWLYTNHTASFIMLMVFILPFMMVGAGLARMKFLEKAAQHTKTLWILLVSSLVVGLVLKTAPYWAEPNLAYQFIQDFIGGPFLMVFYASAIVLLVRLQSVAKLLRPLAMAGRMSMTNYLLQSVIATTIFYSYGLGLYNQVSLTVSTLLAVGIFAIQVILSEIWLSKFKQGPVESVWKKFSYKKS